ncbi:MAG: PD-(D/E)XK nuclease family protein [Bacteroidales bacterium]
MRPFLETLAVHLTESLGRDLANSCIILPNRRAGLFLQRHLANHSHEVIWTPRIEPISDLVDGLSSFQIADPLEIQFILYDLYLGCMERPESFDEFYFWGEMMLGDFDDLDKYLVDAEMVFKNVRDLRELEEPLAGLEESQFRLIRQFWAGFHEGGPTPEKEKFLALWNLLPVLYRRLKETLAKKGWGTQGMQYREIVERIGKDELDWEGGDPVIIVGFNALNNCEKRIFSWLQKRGAGFYWDYDARYVKDDTREAGRFLRENLKQFPESSRLESFDGLCRDKPIRILELPTDVLQAKMVHRILEVEGGAGNGDCTDTAVILCDEDLLMPVVMSLPPAFEEINVTMGYPMTHAPVYSFTDQLITLQDNIRISRKGRVHFYHRDVASILSHPCMRIPGSTPGHGLLREIAARNMMYVDESLFPGELEKMIFRKMGEGAELIGYFRQIYQQLLEMQTGREDRMHQDLDREFIFQVLIHLNKLETLIRSRPHLSGETLIRLFRKILVSMRVPFEGEPLSGLQVMGILETRLLDFRHVIFLSMNEEIMPRSHPGHSFIPYALRAGYGMPVREDMDAIYAYYFYRLMQRAEKVDLIFNSRSEGVRSGEMSRYLTQLKYERGISVIRPELEVRAREIPPLEIEHTKRAETALARYLEGSEEGKYLSPSAINTYIDCPLKFYLRYIAGIGEQDEVKEEVDAAGFGTVVHESICHLYTGIAREEKTMITARELESLLKSPEPRKILEQSFLEHHFKGDRHARIEGRNIIIFRVMLKYLHKILETDLHRAPFEMVSAERYYKRSLGVVSGGSNRSILLGGKIDRVDRTDGRLRVIDYKTGNTSQRFSGVESLFDAGSGNRNGAAMQVLFYAWLVSAQHPGERIRPGLYVMRELYEEDFDPGLRMKSSSGYVSVDSFGSLEEEFIFHLEKVLAEIFDPGIPFSRTENEDLCRNCDFAGICSRISVD